MSQVLYYWGLAQLFFVIVLAQFVYLHIIPIVFSYYISKQADVYCVCQLFSYNFELSILLLIQHKK